jgi:hypothetical protein
MKNFHLPLPEDVYAALREEAAALQRPATVIARAAIDAWLRERRRASVRKSIAAYAVKHAGTTTDPTSKRPLSSFGGRGGGGDPPKLTRRLGTLRQDALGRIEEGLKAALDLD